MTYVLYLLSDTIWTWEFSHRQRPEWDARIDRFARYLADVAASSGRRGNRRRRPQFRDRSWAPRFWRARSSSIRTLDGTARASSC